MIRKLTQNEKSCNPNCDYKIVIPNGESYLTEKQFQELTKDVEILNGRIFSSDDEKICDCIYPIIRDIYPQEYCGDCGKKIP